jgi:hypothetical protein
MKKEANNIAVYNFGILGAIFIMVGTIFPSLFAIFLKPKQPVWESVEVFVEHYHIIQGLPFYFGFFLIGGSIMLLTSIYLLSNNQLYPLSGLIFGIIGAAIISLNYIIQTTLIPALVEDYSSANNAIIASLTMGNPTSFAWAAEMWGYGFIGLATWFAASFFRNKGTERVVKILFILNGILSIAGALYTALDLGWVLTTPGYISFGLWNVLYFLLAGISIRVLLLRKDEISAHKETS